MPSRHGGGYLIETIEDSLSMAFGPSPKGADSETLRSHQVSKEINKRLLVRWCRNRSCSVASAVAGVVVRAVAGCGAGVAVGVIVGAYAAVAGAGTCAGACLSARAGACGHSSDSHCNLYDFHRNPLYFSVCSR